MAYTIEKATTTLNALLPRRKKITEHEFAILVDKTVREFAESVTVAYEYDYNLHIYRIGPIVWTSRNDVEDHPKVFTTLACEIVERLQDYYDNSTDFDMLEILTDIIKTVDNTRALEKATWYEYDTQNYSTVEAIIDSALDDLGMFAKVFCLFLTSLIL